MVSCWTRGILKPCDWNQAQNPKLNLVASVSDSKGVKEPPGGHLSDGYP